MENQVTSLEMSKRLKEAGFTMETPWAYYGNAGEWLDAIVGLDMYSDATAEFKRDKLLPCFSFQQLWEVLPDIIEIDDVLYMKTLSIGNCVYYFNQQKGILKELNKRCEQQQSLLDTASYAVLWCIENGYIKLDKKKDE